MGTRWRREGQLGWLSPPPGPQERIIPKLMNRKDLSQRQSPGPEWSAGPAPAPWLAASTGDKAHVTGWPGKPEPWALLPKGPSPPSWTHHERYERRGDPDAGWHPVGLVARQRRKSPRPKDAPAGRQAGQEGETRQPRCPELSAESFWLRGYCNREMAVQPLASGQREWAQKVSVTARKARCGPWEGDLPTTLELDAPQRPSTFGWEPPGWGGSGGGTQGRGAQVGSHTQGTLVAPLVRGPLEGSKPRGGSSG